MMSARRIADKNARAWPCSMRERSCLKKKPCRQFSLYLHFSQEKHSEVSLCPDSAQLPDLPPFQRNQFAKAQRSDKNLD